MIKATKLNKIYNSSTIANHVLKDISLEIRKGEFISIVGSSGAGKSTLLYLLSLLDLPTSGKLTINKKDITKFSKNQRTKYRLNNFGYVFQDYALLPELTAIENVMLPSLMKGESSRNAKDKGEKILSRLGLKDRFNNIPGKLSGGEQQRVSVARAIVNNPDILFADEPTANLDTKNSQNIIDVFKELNKKGQTIVMVTHEEEYSKQTQRIIHLRDGKIVK